MSIRNKVFLLAMSAALLFTGCMDEKRTVFFMTFHQLAGPSDSYDGGMVIVARSADGKEEKTLRRIPLLSSAYIYKAEMEPSRDGRHFGLRLFLDNHAGGIWHELSIYHKGEELAVIVDGFYAGMTVVPPRPGEEGVLVVDPIWNRREAELIAEHAKINYRVYNGK